MSEKKSPLTRLVLFVISLSVAGTLVAGVYCFAVDQLHQNVVQPENVYVSQCELTCYDKKTICIGEKRRQCEKDYSYLGNSAVLYCEERYGEYCYKTLDACISECEVR